MQKKILLLWVSFCAVSVLDAHRVVGTLKKLRLSGDSLKRVVFSGGVPASVGMYVHAKCGIDPTTANLIAGTSIMSVFASSTYTRNNMPETQYNRQIKQLGKYRENSFIADLFQSRLDVQGMNSVIDKHYVSQKLPRVMAFKDLKKHRENFETLKSELRRIDEKSAIYSGPFNATAFACQDATAVAQEYTDTIDTIMIALKKDPEWAARLNAYYQKKGAKSQEKSAQELVGVRRATWFNALSNFINAFRKK